MQLVGPIRDHQRQSRRARALRTRNASRSREDRSIQCTSSTISSTGRRSASRARTRYTASNNCSRPATAPRRRPAPATAQPAPTAADAPNPSSASASVHHPTQRGDDRRERELTLGQLDALPHQHQRVSPPGLASPAPPPAGSYRSPPRRPPASHRHSRTPRAPAAARAPRARPPGPRTAAMRYGQPSSNPDSTPPHRGTDHRTDLTASDEPGTEQPSPHEGIIHV